MSDEVLIERSLLGLLVTCASTSRAPFASDVMAAASRILDDTEPDYAALVSRLLEAVGLATGLPSGHAMIPSEESVDRAIAALATVVPALGVRVGERPDPAPTGVRLRWVCDDASEGTCMEQVVQAVPRVGETVTLPDGRAAQVRDVSRDYSQTPTLVVVYVDQVSF